MSQQIVPKSKIPVKVVILGSGGVGKTSLTLIYMYHEFVEEYEPTKSDVYNTSVEYNSKNYELNILDTAGQEEYTVVRDANIRSGDKFVLVYSVTDRESYENCLELRETIQRVKMTEEPRIILVGNKVDIVNNDPNARTVTKSEGENLAHQWNANFFEASAKEKINVDEIFMTAVKMADAEQVTKELHHEEVKPLKKKRRCNIL